MAATMVGAAVPAVAGAADATKGFAIRTYKEADLPSGVTQSGSVVTVSEDAVKAGAVKIPVGVYLLEDTPDMLSFNVAVKLDSKASSAKDVKFDYVDSATTYFDSAKTFTLADGTTATSTSPFTFAGTYAKRGGFTPAGTSTYSVADSMKTIFIASRCSESACWDFVPIPVLNCCFLAFLCLRFGLSAVCFSPASTAGLKCKS